MRRKSMLPGAILTLLTLICLLIPARVTWAVRERALGWFSPVLRLFGSEVQAATPDSELPKEIQARLVQLQVLHENDQRVLNSLRGPTVDDGTGVEKPAASSKLATETGPLGRFLARPIWCGRALYTVDVGTNLGVEIGDGVVAQGGGAGVVLALSPTTATFGPLTHPDLSVQAMVARTRAVGLLTGTGRGLELRYLQLPTAAPAGSFAAAAGAQKGDRSWASYGPPPADADTAQANLNPAPGDLVVATGRDGMFPEGTPLGWVESLILDGQKSGGLLKVTVKPWCDPNAADAVRIVARRPEPIPLPEDPRQLRKEWEALQAAKQAAAGMPGAPGSVPTAPAGKAPAGGSHP